MTPTGDFPPPPPELPPERREPGSVLSSRGGAPGPESEPPEGEASPWDRRTKAILIGLAAMAAGLGAALALIVADPPKDQVFVTRSDTVTETTTAVPTTTTTVVTRPPRTTTTTTTETTKTVTETTTEETPASTVTTTVTVNGGGTGP